MRAEVAEIGNSNIIIDAFGRLCEASFLALKALTTEDTKEHEGEP
jgi:hypothetical protein